MPALQAISVHRYRSFAEPTRIDLRPLTLLYGRNNAGKSMLLRLFPILEASVHDAASAPLELSGRAGGDAAFRELVWRGEGGTEFSVGLHWAELDASYTFGWAFDLGVPYVKRLTLELSGAGALRADVEERDAYDVYRITSGNHSHRFRLDFSGLRPELRGGSEVSIPREIRSALESLNHHLGSLRDRTLWLESARVKPPALIQVQGTRPRTLGSHGENAVQFLMAYPHIVEGINTWYGDARIGRVAEIRDVVVGHPTRTLWKQVLLNDTSSPGLDIQLRETGEGMTHVLPLLVALELGRQAGRREASGEVGAQGAGNDDSERMLLAVEEPESHLHDDAQRVLARHMCTVAATAPVTIVAETHSRVLLLGVQSAVANGLIRPDQIRLLWFSQAAGYSQVHQVELKSDGSLVGWPPGVMDEDRHLARELVALQLRREREGAS